ncbi:ABC transporter B family member 4-like [Magnolia sinica]|uniref:ABC transporter B family member 4-like n=1 Tax=Magnolia sinica TaxID=86752 RepID=UPI002657ED8A|nr:ABC transporter B family member 4-like [Magnolia sinica]
MAYSSGIQEGLAFGLGVGLALFIVFCSDGLAVWFGWKMILQKGYRDGHVMNIMFSVLTGSIWIRGKIGLVSQEPVLFTSSIRDNIAYSKDDATIEEIRAAAEIPNAAKFIDKMPQGLDTMVGEHGTQLSGGQKQRIVIATTILKDPRILLLDEATSVLDAEFEQVVQEALDRIMINRTIAIVAHHLSTGRNANMIVMIHQGSIVEKGKNLAKINLIWLKACHF